MQQGAIGRLAAVLEPPLPSMILGASNQPAHQEPLEDLPGALRVPLKGPRDTQPVGSPGHCRVYR
jgi:hypothetical protein